MSNEVAEKKQKNEKPKKIKTPKPKKVKKPANPRAAKTALTIIFSALIFSAFFLSIFYQFPAEWGIKTNYISYGCICAIFLLSLIFMRKNSKQILITLALACTVAADYFLMIALPTDTNRLIGVCIFCGTQFFLMMYTLLLSKGVGLKVTNIAIRVALCLLAYFILPKFITLSVLEMIAVMYFANAVITLLWTLFYIKTEWITFFGMLLFVLCDLIIGFQNGGIALLSMSGPFVEFLLKYDLAYYCYIPGMFLISLSAVWAKKKEV